MQPDADILEADKNNISSAELLILCLRGLPLDPSSYTNWHELLTLAEKHGVLPLIYQKLSECDITPPGFFLDAVVKSRAAAETLATELEALLANFAHHGIEIMPLKGPVLAESLYGAVSLRPSTDLDLMVHRNDFPHADELLANTGWIACKDADTYHKVFLRDDIMVELHFGVAPADSLASDLDSIWTYSIESNFRGQPIRTMSDVDRVLYLCSHGLKHGFYRLIWNIDILRALQAMNHTDLQSLIERARAQGLEQILYIGCEMVCEIFPEQLSSSVLTVFEQSPEMRKKARIAVSRLLDGGGTTSIGPEIWSLYLQTETDTSKRWRRRLKSFSPTREDYSWAEQNHIHRSLMPALRPFRILAKHGPRRIWRNIFPPKG